MSSPGVASSQGERDRATEEGREGGVKKNRRSRNKKNMARRVCVKKDQVCDRRGKLGAKKVEKEKSGSRDFRSSRHSRDCDKPSGRLTGRQAELLDGRIDLESSVVAHTLTPRTEEETGRHEAGNHSSLQLYKVPGYKSLYLTPVSGLVLWVLDIRCSGRM